MGENNNVMIPTVKELQSSNFKAAEKGKKVTRSLPNFVSELLRLVWWGQMRYCGDLVAPCIRTFRKLCRCGCRVLLFLLVIEAAIEANASPECLLGTSTFPSQNTSSPSRRRKHFSMISRCLSVIALWTLSARRNAGRPKRCSKRMLSWCLCQITVDDSPFGSLIVSEDESESDLLLASLKLDSDSTASTSRRVPRQDSAFGGPPRARKISSHASCQQLRCNWSRSISIALSMSGSSKRLSSSFDHTREEKLSICRCCLVYTIYICVWANIRGGNFIWGFLSDGHLVADEKTPCCLSKRFRGHEAGTRTANHDSEVECNETFEACDNVRYGLVGRVVGGRVVGRGFYSTCCGQQNSSQIFCYSIEPYRTLIPPNQKKIGPAFIVVVVMS